MTNISKFSSRRAGRQAPAAPSASSTDSGTPVINNGSPTRTYRWTGPAGTSATASVPDAPVLLSTLWIAVLLADLFRGIHETLRPGFVDELANEGTVYGNTVTDGTLFWSGLVLSFLVTAVVLARLLPRRANRRVNVVAAVLLSAGVLASWPKDPDDLVFGALMLIGAASVVAVCTRWTDVAVRNR